MIKTKRQAIAQHLGMDNKMKKVKTWEDIKNDPRIESVHWQYDGKNKHMIVCEDGFKFENTECSSDIGTIKELCDSVNNYLVTK